MSNENDVSPPEQNESPQQESKETAPQQEAVNPPQSEELDPDQQVDQGSEKAMRILAGMMPWVISALFHVGLFLILVFLVFITVPKSDPEEIIIPSDVLSPDPGGKMSKSTSKVKTSSSSSASRRKVTRQTSKVTTDTAVTKTALTLIGAEGAPSASGGAVGLKSAGSGAGSGSGFFGVRGGNVHNIVYVIDGSGSMEMSGAFRFVREEMYSSIGRLSDKQAFNIILYTASKPVQFQSRLVRADRKNKKKAAVFLSSYTGSLESNPIPAIEKAFKCLRGARKKGKLIYLLSDGEFGGTGQGISNAMVIAKIRQLNANKKVLITTFLFGSKKPAAIKVMQDIADQNGGTFKRIDWGE